MISVKQLSFRYDKKKAFAVEKVSFEVQQGEIFGFLGPSGAGKSTTQKILIRLLKDYQGDISVLGRNLQHWGKNLYEKIGVSFELPNHFQKLTGFENLQFFGSLYSSQANDPLELLESVGLKDDAHTKVAHYSKGMKMRLNFIRSLLNKPELIFLDEPTSGLDPVNAKKIKDIILAEKAKNHTVFLTTHDMYVADQLCDRVAFIVDGKIALIDSPQSLKIKEGKRSVSVRYSEEGVDQEKEFSLLGLGENDEFLQILRTRDVLTIHTKEPSLEDIFIRVTGRSLR